MSKRVLATDENIRNILRNYLEGNFQNYEPIGQWDTSEVTDMSELFDGFLLEDNGEYIRDINNWDVSNVINMSRMFYRSKFNQPLDRWNVSNVEDMSYMFSQSEFNQPLNSWNVSNVLDMNHMFAHNQKFNQPLDKWKLTFIEDMNHMFFGATSFNQDLRSWIDTFYGRRSKYDDNSNHTLKTNMEGMLADTPSMKPEFKINEKMVEQRTSELDELIHEKATPLLYQGFTADKSATNKRPPLPAHISSKILSYVDNIPINTYKMADKGELFYSKKKEQNNTNKEDIRRGGKHCKQKTLKRQSKRKNISKRKRISKSKSKSKSVKYIKGNKLKLR